MTNQRFWDRLLSSIEAGMVVPVLGAQMLCTDNNAESLQAKVAKRVLEFHGHDPDSESPLPLFRELNEVVTRLKDDCNLQDLYADIYDAIESLTKDGNEATPASISQLAAISHFNSSLL